MSTNKIKTHWLYPDVEVHDGEIEYELRGIVTIKVKSNVDLERIVIDNNWYKLKAEGSDSKSALEHLESEMHVEAKIPFELEKIAEMNEGWEIGVEEVEWEWESTYDDNPFVDRLPI